MVIVFGSYVMVYPVKSEFVSSGAVSASEHGQELFRRGLYAQTLAGYHTEANEQKGYGYSFHQ
ncbi:hypothetical protein QNI16_20705 [Cytophagaceae bacterium YF14B1]|uniref:Uncharacterized protein n=1 Tax=Xanthocytophaga flava TaxID=3048013 RepID=A0AAE3QTH1_9BACT|nr:hypothetical protein [Xanthocytophaga flavus]